MKYAVLFSGKIKEGRGIEQVKERLGKIFKLDSEGVERFFKAKSCIIKKELQGETALKIQEGFDKAGALCKIKSYHDNETYTPEEQDFEDTSRIILEMVADFIECPKCGHAQENLGECSECGVVFDKLIKKSGEGPRVFDLP